MKQTMPVLRRLALTWLAVFAGTLALTLVIGTLVLAYLGVFVW